ncbi:MAG: protein kinase [Myxococcota bacterium]
MEPRRCSFCEKESDSSYRFCPHCGREMLATEEEAGDPFIGTLLGGKYRLTQLVGKGGMGTVYRAEHATLGKVFAVKVLSPALRGLPDLAERFQEEARLASRLSHPNCISVVDFGETPGGVLYLVTEFLRGLDLTEILRQGAPLPIARVLGIIRQMLAGLAEAHTLGIVHRDLKPENVMVDVVPGQGDFVKILDFGIARLAGSPTRITRPGLAMGTPDYMAPEQISGHDATPLSDLYSVGLVLYRLLTGEKPFHGDTQEVLTGHLLYSPSPPSGVRRGVPPALDAVVLRALAKRPEERFPSALDFLLALDGCTFVDTPAATRPEDAHAPEIVEPPLAGRDAETARVVALLDGPASAPLLIVGPVGSGRTRMLDEIAAFARSRGRVVVRLAPTAAGRDGPLGPLRRALPGVCGDVPSSGAPEAALASLRGALEGGAVLLADDVEQLPWPCRDAVLRLLACWPGFFAVASSRRDVAAATVEAMTLGPIADADARVVALALGGATAAAGATTGLPLDVVERARFAERFQVAAPATLAEVTATGLRVLPVSALRTAEALAVLGGAAPSSRVALLVDEVVVGYPALRDGDDLRFAHPRLAELVYASIPAEARKALHVRAAEIEEREGAFAGAVAAHLEAAGDTRAAQALERAGFAAADAGDYVGAAVFFRRAFDRLRSQSARGEATPALARLAVCYADALEPLGNRARAAGLLREALEASTGDGQTTVLLRWRLARLALDAGRADLALDELEDARRHLPQVVDARLAAEVWATLARAFEERHQPDRALDAAKEAARASAEDDRWRHLLLAAEIQLRAGRRDAGLRGMREAVRQAERSGADALREAEDRTRHFVTA